MMGKYLSSCFVKHLSKIKPACPESMDMLALLTAVKGAAINDSMLFS
jgi:hypothetical protein